jgi:hypothetical protein
LLSDQLADDNSEVANDTNIVPSRSVDVASYKSKPPVRGKIKTSLEGTAATNARASSAESLYGKMEVVAVRLGEEEDSADKADVKDSSNDDVVSSLINALLPPSESLISDLDEVSDSRRAEPVVDKSVPKRPSSLHVELQGINDAVPSTQISPEAALITDIPLSPPPIYKQERAEGGEGLVVGASPETALLSALASPSGISTKEWGRMYDRASSLSAKTRVWKDLLRKYEELSRRVQELEASAKHPLQKALEPAEPVNVSR